MLALLLIGFSLLFAYIWFINTVFSCVLSSAGSPHAFFADFFWQLLRVRVTCIFLICELLSAVLLICREFLRRGICVAVVSPFLIFCAARVTGACGSVTLPMSQCGRTLFLWVLQLIVFKHLPWDSSASTSVGTHMPATRQWAPHLVVVAVDAVVTGSRNQCLLGSCILSLVWHNFHVAQCRCRFSSALVSLLLLSGSPIALLVHAACSFSDPAFPKRVAAIPNARLRVSSKHRRQQAFLKLQRSFSGAGPETDETKVDAILNTRLALPVDFARCRGRTFRLFQCTRTPVHDAHGVPLCRLHSRGFRRHGLIGSRVTALHRKEFRRYLAKALRQPLCLWFARDALWEEAEARGLSGVAALTDDQYNEALQAVHEYFRRNPAARHNRKLQQLAGPVNASERNSGKEDYLGPTPQLFRFYAYPIFCDELRRLHAALRPENATEREFMTALKATNLRLQRWSAFRTFGDEAWYKGPQSYVQRTDASCMTFSPPEFCTTTPPATSRAVVHGDVWLCCARCSRWRRVDVESSQAYATDVFFIREVQKRLLFIRTVAPRVWESIHSEAARARKAERPFAAATYDASLRLLHETYPEARELFHINRHVLDVINHAAMKVGVRLDDALVGLDANSWDVFHGPRFECANLVNVTCADKPDLEQAVDSVAGYSFHDCTRGEQFLIDSCCADTTFTAVHAAFNGITEHNATPSCGTDRLCTVAGCKQQCEQHWPQGRSIVVVPPSGHWKSEGLRVDGLCFSHWRRLFTYNQTKKKKKQRGGITHPFHTFWTDAELLEEPDARLRTLRSSTMPYRLLRLTCCDVRLPAAGDICYRSCPDGRWDLHTASETLRARLPSRANIYPEHLVPLHSAKMKLPFHEHLLRRVHAVHKILGNLVLFKCSLCKERFPAFHPDHVPEFALRVLASYRNQVFHWDQIPCSERQILAPLHKGTCQRCEDDRAAIEGDELLRDVVLFGKANMMDLLYGYPDVDRFDPLLTADETRLLKLLHEYTECATVVEEMLVSLLHMQIDVCHFRQGRKRSYEGLARYRKNIIAFPQELQEVKQLFHFLTSLNVHDLVNVALPDDCGVQKVRSAKIIDFIDEGFLVHVLEEAEHRRVSFTQVRQRIRLPWRPQDLKDNLIILRRRNGEKDDYVEDLRVRRNFVRGLLQLLTKAGEWRVDRGTEPLHMFYTDFDIRPDYEFEEILPENAVPDGLNFRSVDDVDDATTITRIEFQDWLTEGRHSCDVAQSLLHVWVHQLRGSDCETVVDFFDLLMLEHVAENPEVDETAVTLPLSYLSDFVCKHCTLECALPDGPAASRRQEVLGLIGDELASIQAYMTAWRSCGTLEQEPPRDVVQSVRTQTAQRVLGWPQISKKPIEENSDGRLVKSHPLTFPTGCGDLRQTRLRTDFHPLAWVQHVFRYFDGRVLHTIRGQRAIWAVFNTAMRELARRAGSLVHKRSNTSILTKAELRELVKAQASLVSTLAAFGADMPATAMQSKRSRHEVEWIVRQMSWSPPWTTEGRRAREQHILTRNAMQTTSSDLPLQAPGSSARDPDESSHASPATPPDDSSLTSEEPPARNIPRSHKRRHLNDSSSDSNHPGLSNNKSLAAPSDTTRDASENAFPYKPGTTRKRRRPSRSPTAREGIATDRDGQTASILTTGATMQAMDNRLPLTTAARDIWRSLPNICVPDVFGYDRSPAFWFTLNFPYNHVHDVHRFHRATAEILARPSPPQATTVSTNGLLPVDQRCLWVRNNPDIVCFVHALRVELTVSYVMANIVPPDDAKPFHYWLAFEWGSSGNPHVHGQAYAAGNPSFESVVQDEETRRQLIEHGHADALKLRTRAEAELDLGNFFDDYIKEWHPSKDDRGKDLYPFALEIIRTAEAEQPQCTDLLALLDRVFADDNTDPDLTSLQHLLLGLIETGQRHTWHGHRKAPEYGVDPCARKGSTSEGKHYVYCRYLFPRLLRLFHSLQRAVVEDDPHRPGLRNLFLARNDPLINPFEPHLLLCNLGNIDWRALLNLWAVLEYLTKYATKLGTGTSSLQKTFMHVVQAVDEFDMEDGLHDLWRRAIMKFYSRTIGGRDFSLLETLHYGLRLPNTLSTFGAVRTVSLSGWSSVRSRQELCHLSAQDRATYFNKIELFDMRGDLERPRTVQLQDLENLSLYAFWRLFDVQGKKLVKKRTEQFVALSGLGWPPQAKQSHAAHAEYAKRTLLCYMPCPGLRGTDWIKERVDAEFQSSWPVALWSFVMDAHNKWCPTWVVRNYEAHNEVIQGLPQLSAAPPVISTATQPADAAAPGTSLVPHAKLFKTSFLFEETGEPGDHNDAKDYEQRALEDCWSPTDRAPWQLHSALGPNIKPNELRVRVAPLQDVVNPPTHDYTTNPDNVQLHHVNAFWAELAKTTSRYDDHTLNRADLDDDYQQLFVDILLRHMAAVIAFAEKRGPWVPPLRLLLLGGPGTGKTRTVQTTLQEIYRLLDAAGLPIAFVRCAAPTGCAAFNLRFNATTIHRLINLIPSQPWAELSDDRLVFLQAHLAQTRLLLIDEVSMVGRQFMGKIDSRCCQGKAATNVLDASLGGMSCALVGDPAQIEAIQDQQFYDRTAHKDTAHNPQASHVALSNRGLDVYGEFDWVVVLSTVHRLHKHEHADTPEKQLFNERSDRFLRILHALRNASLTHEDYFWLCRLKRCHASASRRAFFADAPVLMEFRRTTEANEEDNCEYYNRQRLRVMAKTRGVPVIAFDAVHDGKPQQDAMEIADASFSGLQRRLELAEGARIILTHNLSVEHGLINGSQGAIVSLLFLPGTHPNHANIHSRMPFVLVAEFPSYNGPPFFTDPDKRHWVPLLPRTARCDGDHAITRTQFPVCLAYALTPWKAQGMTLAKVIVMLRAAGAKPGVLLVALSRVRHPDHLLLEDDFPSLATIQSQVTSHNFQMRQRWEKLALVKFSNTIREHMRDPNLFSPNAIWTSESSALADALLAACASSRNQSDETLVAAVVRQHISARTEEVASVWQRLHTYPHVFAVHHANGVLSQATLQGDIVTTTAPPTIPPYITFEGWKVNISDFETYINTGRLSEPVFEMLAKVLRRRLPSHIRLYRPDQLRNRKLSASIFSSECASQPSHALPLQQAFLPVHLRSQQWALYWLSRGCTSQPIRCTGLFASETAAGELWAATSAYIAQAFSTTIPAVTKVPVKEYTDLCVFFVLSSLSQRDPVFMMPTNAHTLVKDAASFFTTLLHSLSVCSSIDFDTLQSYQPSLGSFLNQFATSIVPALPSATSDGQPPKLRLHLQQQANASVSPTATTSQSQGDLLKRRRLLPPPDTSAAPTTRSFSSSHMFAVMPSGPSAASTCAATSPPPQKPTTSEAMPPTADAPQGKPTSSPAMPPAPGVPPPLVVSSHDALHRQCQRYLYGSPKIIEALPLEYRQLVQHYGVFRKVRTKGDGACALHAPFGVPTSADELAAHSACRPAVADLLRQVADDFHGQSISVAQRLTHLVAILWGFVSAHLRNDPDRDSEADLFWQALPPPARASARAAFDNHQRARNEQQGQLELFDVTAARVCSTLPADVLLEPLALTLEGCLDEWHEPAWEVGSGGALIVKGSLSTPVPFPTDNPPYDKLAALADPRACFNALRRAFFIRGRGADNNQQQAIVSVLYDLTENTPSARQDLEQFARLLLTDFHQAHITPEAPATFAPQALLALSLAVRQPSYWFSVDELLLIADLLHQNVVVVEEFARSFHFAGSSFLRPQQPVAFVSLRSGRARNVRSHFTRLVPTSPGSTPAATLLRRRPCSRRRGTATSPASSLAAGFCFRM